MLINTKDISWDEYTDFFSPYGFLADEIIIEQGVYKDGSGFKTIVMPNLEVVTVHIPLHIRVGFSPVTTRVQRLTELGYADLPF